MLIQPLYAHTMPIPESSRATDELMTYVANRIGFIRRDRGRDAVAEPGDHDA